MKKILFWIIFLIIHCQVTARPVIIAVDTTQKPLIYAARRLAGSFFDAGIPSEIKDLESATGLAQLTIILPANLPYLSHGKIDSGDFNGIHPEGFRFIKSEDGLNLTILSPDATGAMYGMLELIGTIGHNGLLQWPHSKTVNPSLTYRIIKFNLPWSPYRAGKATSLHVNTCRDLAFWEKFLDMMADNRWNVLSLWNNHPFPFLIKPKNFPLATPLTDAELGEWQLFWKTLFSMAKQRGIQTFIVNWNIVVSPEFAQAYGVKEYNDLSELVKTYTRECATQVINEYADLTGIGVTLADWMGNFGGEEMNPQKREDWIGETFIAGMQAAQRPVKFLHRSVLAGDPLAMRALLSQANLAEPALVEIKFNWSHAHSTPTLSITHDYHSGQLDDRFWNPLPEQYRIQWMMRNEDFFILRWAEPDFIRNHLQQNVHPYVNGYFVGSEGYIPAVDYASRPGTTSWTYAFEKQWLFYKTWGRLLYDPSTPDQVFEDALEQKYGAGIGQDFLMGYRLASRMPLRLASFFRSTWDYTLYSEGFISAEPSNPKGLFDRSSPFISLDEFMNHETLDPQMVSISAYVDSLETSSADFSKKITPLMLADQLEHDAKQALSRISGLRKHRSVDRKAYHSELDDLATWCYLSLYMAVKLRAGVSVELYLRRGDEYLKKQALDHLEHGIRYWDQVIKYTWKRYHPVPHVAFQRWGTGSETFSWFQLRDQVLKDVTWVKGLRTK